MCTFIACNAHTSYPNLTVHFELYFFSTSLNTAPQTSKTLADNGYQHSQSTLSQLPSVDDLCHKVSSKF